jgi:hypothetical protein
MSESSASLRRRWIGSGVALVVVLWAVVAGLTVLDAATSLHAARGDLAAAEDGLRDAELRVAREHLDDAVTSARRSSSRLGGPQLAPLRAVPVVAQNLRAARALSDAARDVGSASADLLTVADGIVRDDREAELGELSVAYVRDLAGPLRTLADVLATATARVERDGHPRLLDPVADARAAYLDIATPALAQAEVGAELAEVLPRFLGAEEPRTYLVAAAALSEVRGSGGLLGSYSTMTVDEGRFEFADFGDIEDLERSLDDPAVSAPDTEYERRYARLGGLHLWRNANLSAHFPWTAEVLLSLWEADGGTPLDGVLVADAVFFEQMVERSGPIDVPGTTTLTADTTRRFVGLDAYAEFDDNVRRKQVLGMVATAAFERAFAILEDRDVPATVELLSSAASEGHLRVYSRDQEVQSALDRAGVGGGLPSEEGEFGALIVNNVAANKVDYFTRRTVEHHVELLPDGVTRGRVAVRFDNEAPVDGFPRHVLGPWTDGVGPGDNLSAVTFLCGRGCQVEQVPEGTRAGGTERGLVASDVRVRIPAEDHRRLEFETRTPSAWSDVDGGAELTIRHHRQSTITDDELVVSVAIPEGFVLESSSEEVEVTDGTVTYRPEANASVSIDLRFRPTR